MPLIPLSPNTINDSLEEVACAVLLFVFNVPGAEGIVTVFLVAVTVKSPSVAVSVPVKLSTYVIVPLVEVAVPLVAVSLCFACSVNVPAFLVNPHPLTVLSVTAVGIVTFFLVVLTERSPEVATLVPVIDST